MQTQTTAMANVISIKKLKQLEYEFIEIENERMARSFGRLTTGFRMFVWGESGNGKSSLTAQLLEAFSPRLKTLYVALEEGFESTIQNTVNRHLPHLHEGVMFADATMTYADLVARLAKKRSENLVVVDSVQYMDMTKQQYKHLVSRFRRKAFIFLSHADGKNPKGTLADHIRYDAGVKVFVKGYLGFVQSRYGGNTPFVVWEQEARSYWGDGYEAVLRGLRNTKPGGGRPGGGGKPGGRRAGKAAQPQEAQPQQAQPQEAEGRGAQAREVAP